MMQEQLSTESILKLTYQSISENIKFFFILALIFITLNFPLNIIIERIPEEDFFISFFISLILYLIFIKMAVMIHRSILLNEYNISNVMSWSKIEFKFIFWVFGIYFISFGVGGMLMAFIIPFTRDNNGGAFIGFAMIILMVIASILISRLSLIFPGVAIGEKMSLGIAWKASKGHVTSLLILLIGAPFLTNTILNKLPTNNDLWSLFSTLITVLVVIFEIAILTHCYHALFNTDETVKHSM